MRDKEFFDKKKKEFPIRVEAKISAARTYLAIIRIETPTMEELVEIIKDDLDELIGESLVIEAESIINKE